MRGGGVLGLGKSRGFGGGGGTGVVPALLGLGTTKCDESSPPPREDAAFERDPLPSPPAEFEDSDIIAECCGILSEVVEAEGVVNGFSL